MNLKKSRILLNIIACLFISSCAVFEDFMHNYNAQMNHTENSTESNLSSGLAGIYNGSSDVYLATTGSTFRSQSTRVEIRYFGNDEFTVAANVDRFGSFFARGKADIFSPLRYQSGNLRYTFSGTKIGNRLKAQLIVERQRSNGSYELIKRARVNAIN
jgi:hypothetical protein